MSDSSEYDISSAESSDVESKPIESNESIKLNKPIESNEFKKSRIRKPINAIVKPEIIEMAQSTELVKAAKVRKPRGLGSKATPFHENKVRDEAVIENSKMINTLLKEIELLKSQISSEEKNSKSKRDEEMKKLLNDTRTRFAKMSR